MKTAIELHLYVNIQCNPKMHFEKLEEAAKI